MPKISPPTRFDVTTNGLKTSRFTLNRPSFQIKSPETQQVEAKANQKTELKNTDFTTKSCSNNEKIECIQTIDSGLLSESIIKVELCDRSFEQDILCSDSQFLIDQGENFDDENYKSLNKSFSAQNQDIQIQTLIEDADKPPLDSVPQTTHQTVEYCVSLLTPHAPWIMEN